jgi:hypothetical protein
MVFPIAPVAHWITLMVTGRSCHASTTPRPPHSPRRHVAEIRSRLVVTATLVPFDSSENAEN